jgi:hypothetical protein
MRKFLIAISSSIVFAAMPAQAAGGYLVSTWFNGANQMCKYSDGSVLNVGARTCPLRIGN